MYLGIDIGGTKTLIGVFNSHGDLTSQSKFLTPHDYTQFIKETAKVIANLPTKDFRSSCVALPGRIDRIAGVGIACGNLPWRNVPIRRDIEKILNCPTVVENDANLAGLSEAIVVKNIYRTVLYVTISTGIGTGIIIDQKIDPDFEDSEGGHIILEHRGKRQMWEKFASGSAMVKRFGKRAEDIHDAHTWQIIAQNISVGLLDLSAIIQPDVIILGGSVSDHLDRFEKYLKADMQQYATPLTPVPPIQEAARPHAAVVYGCYHLAQQYARSHTKITA